MLRVLHLEDDLGDRDLVEKTLKKQGLRHQAWWVNTKVSFCTVLDRLPVDVVLCDSGAPGFAGKEALELVRKRQPNAAFIFVTGHTSGPTFEALKNSGADAVVSKSDLPLVGDAVVRALKAKGVEIERRGTEGSGGTPQSGH
jgi:DNA-binding NarL/FixJ family response regulator